MDRSTLKLTELTDAILSQMDASGFMESTRGFYVTLFRRLCRMAKERGIITILLSWVRPL